MEIKRLLYQQKEDNFEVGVGYKGAREVTVLTAKNGIFPAFCMGEETFSEDEFFPDMETGKYYYRMGWNTMAICEKTATGFRVINRHDPTSNSEKTSYGAIDGREFSQIATQAVETCTLVYIETERHCFFAHFLDTRLKDFMNYLQKVLPIQTVKTFFCSLLTTKNTRDESWKNGYKLMLAFKDRAEKFILFDRSRMNDSYLTHMEFGVGMDDRNQITYYGDICCSTPEIRNTRKTFCCCSLFSFNEAEALMNLKAIGNNVLAREIGNP